MKINNKAYTLVEIIVGVLIFSIVIVTGFYALTKINSGKIKLAQQTSVTKEAYFFSEKLFQEIKKGGTIDYEEYFNRKVVGTTTQSGYYNLGTGFGNFGQGGTISTTTYGNGFYFCRSLNGVSLGLKEINGTTHDLGCYKKGTFTTTPSVNNTTDDYSTTSTGTAYAAVSADKQRYGQYYYQFVDYNVDADNDDSPTHPVGDSDSNDNIIGDLDDEHLGKGPKAFSGSMLELYLIGDNGKSRTYFRRNFKLDSNRPNPSTNTCDNISQEGCLGTLQILKLVGKDWGLNHSKSGTGAYDGIIDTWITDPDIYGTGAIAGSVDMTSYWQDMFPSTLNVTDFRVDLFPDVYKVYGWKEMDALNDINPYIKLSLSIKPSWLKRRGILGDVPEIKYQTTINLVDYLD